MKLKNQGTSGTQSRKTQQRKSAKKPDHVSTSDHQGKPLSGVGRKIGRAFIEAYFPEAVKTIRVATAYFQLAGYKIARPYIQQGVQIHILVGKEEGQNVKAAVIKEIIDNLGQCQDNIWGAVADLVARMRGGTFFIRDARELMPPFHAKFYICDNKLVWHGSANFSHRGLMVAREQASIIRRQQEVQAFTDWFDNTVPEAKDLLADLIVQLQKWLDLATPIIIFQPMKID